MDIIYLNRKPILHVVNAATVFQVGQFLNNMSAKKTWETLRQYWIDTYLGLLDIITYDAGTNFDFTKFWIEAKILSITCYQISVEAHCSIKKNEKCHVFIRCTYDIIQAETRGIISKNAML